MTFSLAPDDNICEGESIIQSVVERARNYAFQEGKVDLRLCYSSKARIENRQFIRENNILPDDILSALSRLRLEEYCETSRESGKTDAYVFGIDLGEDLLAYFKFSFREGVLVLSFHEPKRIMRFPFRKGK